MVDILQALEGAAYAAFIAGAVFAVFELRSMRKDRELDFFQRLNEFWCSRDFEDAVIKIRTLPPDIEDPGEIEDICGALALWTYVDYLDGVGLLARGGLLSKDIVIDMADWQGLWTKLEPWIFHQR